MERIKDLEAAQIFSHEAKNAFITSGSVTCMLNELLTNHYRNYPMEWKPVEDLMSELIERCKKGVALCMNETLWRSLLHGTYIPQLDDVRLGVWLDNIGGQLSEVHISSFLRDKYTKLDKALVETILNNAISNAIKYGDEKEKPKIIVQQNHSANTLQITVRNVAGIDHNSLLKKIETGWNTDQLFDKNVRLQENKCKKSSSGHGLWVTKLAALELNGDVKLCIYKKYSDFCFSLPCKTRASLAEIKMPSLSIAILDDDRIERLTIERQFGKLEWIRNLHIRGKTSNESLQFPQYIIHNNIDIAIFDENLQEDIIGSDLMIKAKRDGFKGIMVSRSSMDALGGIGLISKITDGFLPKSINNQADITARLYDIYQYVFNSKMTEPEAISSITKSAVSSDYAFPFMDDERNSRLNKLPICIIPDTLTDLMKDDSTYYIVLEFYDVAKEEINKLIAETKELCSYGSKIYCSKESKRPWKYIHKLKGLAINTGFKRLEDYTYHLCNLKNELTRDVVYENISSLSLVALEAFGFVDGFLKSNKSN